MNINDNWLLYAVLIPAVILILQRRVINSFTVIRLYHTRNFDKDRDPDTPEQAEILSRATGKWTPVLVTYNFSLFAKDRRVIITHLDSTGKPIRREKMRFIAWSELRAAERLIPYPWETEE